MSRSKVKVTRDKKMCSALLSRPGCDGTGWNLLAANNVTQQTIPSLPGGDFYGLRVVYVW